MKRRSKKEFPIKLIQPNDFEREVESCRETALFLCTRRDYEFLNQVQILKEVLENMPDDNTKLLQVYLVDEGFQSTFMDKLNVEGSPTFLFFENGKEKDRLLGLADQDRLRSFIAKAMGHNM
jgi:Thioredoxin